MTIVSVDSPLQSCVECVIMFALHTRHSNNSKILKSVTRCLFSCSRHWQILYSVSRPHANERNLHWQSWGSNLRSHAFPFFRSSYSIVNSYSVHWFTLQNCRELRMCQPFAIRQHSKSRWDWYKPNVVLAIKQHSKSRWNGYKPNEDFCDMPHIYHSVCAWVVFVEFEFEILSIRELVRCIETQNFHLTWIDAGAELTSTSERMTTVYVFLIKYKYTVKPRLFDTSILFDTHRRQIIISWNDFVRLRFMFSQRYHMTLVVHDSLSLSLSVMQNWSMKPIEYVFWHMKLHRMIWITLF